MSNAVTARFAIEQTADHRWRVLLDRSSVTVQTRQEAELIASLPVELAKFASDSRKPPDIRQARRVVEACKAYGLYTVFAVRQLERRVKDYEAKSRRPKNGSGRKVR